MAYLSEAEVLEDILLAKLHLVDIRVEDADALQKASKASVTADSNTSYDHESATPYAGITGFFCTLDWSVHKLDPASTPMFRDLTAKSASCDGPRKMDLGKVVQAARERDSDINPRRVSSVHVLNLAAVVFHESRCGSTLVANILAGMNPAAHRVYSESPPPLHALKTVCGEDYSHCTKTISARILRDVIYLMSRSNDLKETRVFFKVQSLGSRNIEVFQQAFPATPWLFVYRDPVEILMSQLANGPRNANCVRPQRLHTQPTSVHRVWQHRGSSATTNLKTLSPEEYCAVHLATITETAVEQLQYGSQLQGVPINYASLKPMLLKVLPTRLNVTMGPEEVRRIDLVASQYSKGRGSKAGIFTEDSHQKQSKATEAIRKAARTYLQPSYEALEQLAS